MLDLIHSTIEAHGGQNRWKRIRQISATLSADGLALEMSGHEAFRKTPTRIVVDTHLQRVTFEPFLAPGQIGIYQPFRAAVETIGGVVIEGLDNPRNTFHWLSTPWSAPQLAFFAGYSLWSWLTLPFTLLSHGVEYEVLSPWIEDGETWRVVKAIFPKTYVMQSSDQVLYFDERGRLRRVDYGNGGSGGNVTSHYLSDYREVDGLLLPGRRRAYRCGPDRLPDRTAMLLSDDLDDFQLLCDETGSGEDWNVSTCD